MPGLLLLARARTLSKFRSSFVGSCCGAHMLCMVKGALMANGMFGGGNTQAWHGGKQLCGDAKGVEGGAYHSTANMCGCLSSSPAVAGP